MHGGGGDILHISEKILQYITIVVVCGLLNDSSDIYWYNLTGHFL